MTRGCVVAPFSCPASALGRRLDARGKTVTEPIYTPGERLYLWYLREPQKLAWVGTLSLVLTGTRGVSLRYAPDWLRTPQGVTGDGR